MTVFEQDVACCHPIFLALRAFKSANIQEKNRKGLIELLDEKQLEAIALVFSQLIIFQLDRVH